MKHKKIFVVLGVLGLVLGSSIYSKEKSKQDNNLPDVDKEMLMFFEKNIDYKEIVTYSQDDINEDNREDLVVVYSQDDKKNHMVVVINDANKMYTTKPILAPKEDVIIEFKNIDDKNQKELVISGSKNGSVGYAIYRLKNKELLNLFGEGMEACC